MQGPIENALMLVAAGNAYLAGRDIGAFWPEADTFRYVGLCEFRTPPASGKDEDAYPLRAGDPMGWFASLKTWCTGLRLHHAPGLRGQNQQIEAPDRMLVGFVGGGARWLIEAAGRERSELWEGFHRFGDRKDAKPWLCTHILQGEVSLAEVEPQAFEPAVAELRGALVEIEAFARSQQLDNFAECFARGSALLESGEPESMDWLDRVMRHAGLDRRQASVLQAINHAWVFGGMGSWNDLGLGGEPYDGLSERLYAALNNAVAGLANATFRG